MQFPSITLAAKSAVPMPAVTSDRQRLLEGGVATSFNTIVSGTGAEFAKEPRADFEKAFGKREEGSPQRIVGAEIGQASAVADAQFIWDPSGKPDTMPAGPATRPPDLPREGLATKNAFYDAAGVLCDPEAIKAMDELEAAADGSAVAGNGCFGTRGISLLAEASASDDAFWGDIDRNLSQPQRQAYIDAAKNMSAPENAGYLTEMSSGDGKFDVDELRQAVDAYRDQQIPDGNVNIANQGKAGNCWLVASVNAMTATDAGRRILRESMAQNPDGSYTVTFAGDPAHPVVVSAVDVRDMADLRFSNGDMDMRILEVAAEKYVRSNPTALGQSTTVNGGGQENALKLLTGMDNIYYRGFQRETGDAKEVLEFLAQHASSNRSITFGAQNGDDGMPQKTGRGREHLFTVLGIDGATGTVTFTNPFDPGKIRTMSIDELSFAIDSIGTVNYPPN